VTVVPVASNNTARGAGPLLRVAINLAVTVPSADGVPEVVVEVDVLVGVVPEAVLELVLVVPEATAEGFCVEQTFTTPGAGSLPKYRFVHWAAPLTDRSRN
jgi:hypothetical protein